MYLKDFLSGFKRTTKQERIHKIRQRRLKREGLKRREQQKRKQQLRIKLKRIEKEKELNKKVIDLSDNEIFELVI